MLVRTRIASFSRVVFQWRNQEASPLSSASLVTQFKLAPVTAALFFSLDSKQFSQILTTLKGISERRESAGEKRRERGARGG